MQWPVLWFIASMFGSTDDRRNRSVTCSIVDEREPGPVILACFFGAAYKIMRRAVDLAVQISRS